MLAQRHRSVAPQQKRIPESKYLAEVDSLNDESPFKY